MTHTPSPCDKAFTRLREAGLVAQHELYRLFHTPRAAIFILIYVVIACISAIIFSHVADFAEKTSLTDTLRTSQVYSGTIEATFGKDALEKAWLMGMPPFILFFFKFGVTFLPGLAVLTGFDAISSELATGSLRYLAPRTHRSATVFGKALASLIIVGVLSLLLFAFAMVFSLATDSLSPSEPNSLLTTLLGTLCFLGISLAVLLPYIGLTMLFSALTKTPLYALVFTICAIIGQWILALLSNFDSLAFLKWFVPSTYEPWILGDSLFMSAVAVGIMFVFSGIFLGLGTLRLHRADL